MKNTTTAKVTSFINIIQIHIHILIKAALRLGDNFSLSFRFWFCRFLILGLTAFGVVVGIAEVKGWGDHTEPAGRARVGNWLFLCQWPIYFSFQFLFWYWPVKLVCWYCQWCDTVLNLCFIWLLLACDMICWYLYCPRVNRPVMSFIWPYMSIVVDVGYLFYLVWWDNVKCLWKLVLVDWIGNIATLYLCGQWISFNHKNQNYESSFPI